MFKLTSALAVAGLASAVSVATPGQHDVNITGLSTSPTVQTFRLARGVVEANDEAYVAADLRAHLDTEPGYKNRRARLYMMGEARATADDTPDASLRVYFAGTRMNSAYASGGIRLNFAMAD